MMGGFEMALILIPIYWVLAFGVVALLSPSIEIPIIKTTSIESLLFLSVASMLSAETFFWWQEGGGLVTHFKSQWRPGIFRAVAALVAGVAGGAFGLFIGIIQSSTFLGVAVVSLLGLCSASIFIWVQTHRYLVRVANG